MVNPLKDLLQRAEETHKNGLGFLEQSYGLNGDSVGLERMAKRREAIEESLAPTDPMDRALDVFNC